MSEAVVVVQARMGSTRLPGKVLAEVGGRPLLGLMLARLAPLADTGCTTVVATSDLDRDDPVAEVAEAAGVRTFRGDEGDVLGRFAGVLGAHPAPVVVRLTADCPLIDPTIVSDVIEQHRREGADYTSNTLVRTFPDGLDVEVVDADALARAAAEATEPAEREHVTPFVYRRPERFALAQHTSGLDLGDERWTVDRPEDLEVVRAAVARAGDATAAGWRELAAVLGATAPPTPEDAVSARPAPPVPHRRGAPYQRRFRLVAPDGGPAGTAAVEVAGGIGRLRIDLDDPSADRRAAVAAVRTWLAADLQVTDLLDPEGTDE